MVGIDTRVVKLYNFVSKYCDVIYMYIGIVCKTYGAKLYGRGDVTSPL
jgi:hypothetical protein